MATISELCDSITQGSIRIKNIIVESIKSDGWEADEAQSLLDELRRVDETLWSIISEYE